MQDSRSALNCENCIWGPACVAGIAAGGAVPPSCSKMSWIWKRLLEGTGVIFSLPATIVSIQETSVHSLLGNSLCRILSCALCVNALMKFAAHFFGQLQLFFFFFLISRASEERKLNVDILQYFALKSCQSKWSVGIVFIKNVCFV